MSPSGFDAEVPVDLPSAFPEVSAPVWHGLAREQAAAWSGKLPICEGLCVCRGGRGGGSGRVVCSVIFADIINDHIVVLGGHCFDSYGGAYPGSACCKCKGDVACREAGRGGGVVENLVSAGIGVPVGKPDGCWTLHAANLVVGE